MKSTIANAYYSLKESFNYEIERNIKRINEKRFSKQACKHIYRNRLESLENEVNEYIIMLDKMFKYNLIDNLDEYENCKTLAKELLIKINGKISSLPSVRRI